MTYVVISWWFCCIYAWLDPSAYMIARFISFVNRVLHTPTQTSLSPASAMGGLRMSRSTSRPNPVLNRARSTEFGELRRTPSRAAALARPSALDRSIRGWQPRLEPEPPDLDPTDQIARYRFARYFCKRAPEFSENQPAVQPSSKIITNRPLFLRFKPWTFEK